MLGDKTSSSRGIVAPLDRGGELSCLLRDPDKEIYRRRFFEPVEKPAAAAGFIVRPSCISQQDVFAER